MNSAIIDMINRKRNKEVDINDVLSEDDITTIKKETIKNVQKGYKNLYEAAYVMRIESFHHASDLFLKIMNNDYWSKNEVQEFKELLELVQLCTAIINDADEKFNKKE